jgi:hypothetical protein
MRRALEDAGIESSAVDYVNLHGTGTVDNDAAEAKAIQQVFGATLPALSSTKGLTGHPLAAAGAIEAVISVIALTDGLLPANTGLDVVDPRLGLSPVLVPTPTRAGPHRALQFLWFWGQQRVLDLAGARGGVTRRPSKGCVARRCRPCASPVPRASPPWADSTIRGTPWWPDKA